MPRNEKADFKQTLKAFDKIYFFLKNVEKVCLLLISLHAWHLEVFI